VSGCKRIVVVEDEAYAVLSVEMVLRMLGHDLVGAAASGEQALAIIAREQPDLVLVDVRLSGALDGFETVGRMRQSHPAPVIFMTGYRDAATLAKIAAVEHAMGIFKPFTADDIALAVRTMLP